MAQQVYEKLNAMFGGDPKGQQIFQMEFPARLLDKGTYDYVGSDTINAQQIKPQVVQEAEFNLSNDLLGLGTVIGGPTGEKLSEQYEDIIFGLIPTVSKGDQAAELLHTDQDQIFDWLLEKVPNFTLPDHDILQDIPPEYDQHKPGKPKSLDLPGEAGRIPRVDLYQKLLDEYEAQRFRWVTFKLNARPKDLSTADPLAIDNYNRMLANFGPVVDAKLEAFWTMVLVRGQYHRVRRFIGFVDIDSAPESLQRAKENLRAAVMRSIDNSQDIYPVFFTPATWASKLSTAFKPEDLLSSEDAIQTQLFDKIKERSLLILKQNEAKAAQVDAKPLEDAEEVARGKYLASRDKMLANYSSAAISIIQMYFEAKRRKTRSQEAMLGDIGDKKELNDMLEARSQPPISDKDFADLKVMQNETITNQTNLQNASEAVSRAQLAAASARGGDMTAYIYELTEKINSLSIDIDYLQKILDTSENPTGKALTTPAGGTGVISIAPTKPIPIKAPLVPQDKDASVWQECMVTTNTDTSQQSSTSTASARRTDWSVDLFIGSASGSVGSSSGSSTSTYSSHNTNISIAMRVMKVVMNRPWFNPGVLASTVDYFRNFKTPITPAGPGIMKAAFLGEANISGSNKQTAAQLLDSASNCKLPAYPVAFIVAKDIHIIFENKQGWSAQATSDIQKSMSAGGGAVCFSCSRSESSSEHRMAAAVSSEGERLSIRIPAPQIVGWIQHLAPEDLSQQVYGPIDPVEFVNQAEAKRAEVAAKKSNVPAINGTGAPTVQTVAA